MATTKLSRTSKDKQAEEEAPAEDAPTLPESNDIDARMAALLKDHQRMGARPKE